MRGAPRIAAIMERRELNCRLVNAILVTGGAGFVGATLVRRLAAAGYLVRVLDNLSTGDAAHLAGLRAFGLRSLLIVPLSARGRTLGKDAMR